VGDALLQRVGEVLDDDDGLGAGVLELVLQLARRVQRVDVDHHQAGAQDGGHGHRVLRHVGHHDGDAVALGQAQALQVGGEGVAQGIGLAIADFLAHEAVGRAVRVLAEALFHQLDERGVLRRVDVGRHAGRIGTEPGTVHHACLLQIQTFALAADCVARPRDGDTAFSLGFT